MSNQKMGIPDAKLSIPTILPVDSTCLRPTPQFSFPWMKLLEKLGFNPRVNALLDSMRSSSPTGRRPAKGKDHDSWMVNHPSALTMFENIMRASKGKQIVVFLDYDGTLSPIVDDPRRAFLTHAMRDAVRGVANFFPTAIVSGRSREKVHDLVRLTTVYYAGSHGLDIMKGPGSSFRGKKHKINVLCQPATEFLGIIDEVSRTLIKKVKLIPGAKVENNRFCLSVHYRCVDEKKWKEVASEVHSVITKYPQLRLSHGRKVFNIHPGTVKWDTGNAVEFLLKSMGYVEANGVFPIYIGDDVTDEDAFRVLRERGVGILVTKVPKQTDASYTLQEPIEVRMFLERLVECKKQILSSCC